MATYVVSFRIGQDSEYAQRWKSVVEAIHNQADDGTCWEETTSLIIFRSSKSAEQIALDVYIGSTMSTASDTLLVVNASNGTYATRGEVKYPHTLASLFSQNSLGGLLGVRA